MRHDIPHDVLAALVQQHLQAFRGNIDGANLRAEVQRHRVGQAGVVDEYLFGFLDQFAPIEDLHEKARRIVVEGSRVDAETALVDTTDIGMVQNVGDPHEDPVVSDQWAGDHHVVLMQRPQKRVVEHIGIAGRQGACALDDRRHGIPHGRHVDEGADTGGDKFRIRRKQSDIVIVAFDHDRRGRYGLDGEALLVINLPEPVFDDFKGDGIDHDSVCGTMAILPSMSIVADAPGGSQIVVVSRSMIAGP